MSAPDMSYLCRDWTPTVDDPVVECHMPAGRAVRIELEIAKYQSAAVPTLLLYARANSGKEPSILRHLWDVTIGLDDHLVLDPAPVSKYYRFARSARSLSPVRAGGLLEVEYNPCNLITYSFLQDIRPRDEADPTTLCWRTTIAPWVLTIGCPKEFSGTVTPLGSVITCRWEILDSKGGPT